MVIKKGFSRFWPIIVVLPALILYGLFVFIPTIGNFIISFTDFSGNINSYIHWKGLYNYKRAFSYDMTNLGNAIINTIIFSVLVTCIQNVTAVLLAVLVNLKLSLRNIYRAIIFLPSMLGVIVTGLVWNLILDPYSGPVNLLLGQFGLDSALLGDPKIALYFVIFVAVWMNVGTAMILYLAGLQSIPMELYEAARIDGSKGAASLFHITLPLLRPTITINVLISLIGTLLTYDIIIVLTNGGPGIATMTLGLYIFKSLFTSGVSQGYVSALSFIHVALISVVVLIVQYYLRRREAEM